MGRWHSYSNGLDIYDEKQPSFCSDMDDAIATSPPIIELLMSHIPGTKVIAGGLDTLETIGKKTMEVLQDGDPGLAKKRAMLGLDHGDKPILSQV